MMRRLTLVLLVLVVTGRPALGQARGRATGDASVKAALVALEKQSWEAWKSKNADFFRQHLAPDAIQNGAAGLQTRDQIIGGMTGSECEVRSYGFDEGSFQAHMLDANTALLTFKATQDYTCNGKPGPSPVWATSMYVRRNGRWLNAFYQETRAEP